MNDRFDGLVQAYFDGRLESDEREELRALLQRGPDERREFAKQCVVHGHLSFDGNSVMSAGSIDRGSKVLGMSRWWWGAAVAAALMLMLYGLGVVGAHSAREEVVVHAVLKGAFQLERDGVSFTSVPDGALRVGDRIMADGLVRLTYKEEDTGIALDPGAIVQIGSHKEGKLFILEEGRLEADVAPQPAGWSLRIRTGQGVVTVVGTAFNLATDGVLTKIAVTEGTVRIGATEEDAGILVKGGERALIGSDGLARIDDPPVSMVIDGSFEAGSPAWKGLRHPRLGWYQGRHLVDTDAADGTWSLRMQLNPQSRRVVFQSFDVVEGQRLRFSLQVKRLGPPEQAFRVHLLWLKSSVSELETMVNDPDYIPELGTLEAGAPSLTDLMVGEEALNTPASEMREWTELSGILVAPPGARSLRVNLELEASEKSGFLLVDDLKIHQLGSR